MTAFRVKAFDNSQIGPVILALAAVTRDISPPLLASGWLEKSLSHPHLWAGVTWVEMQLGTRLGKST